MDALGTLGFLKATKVKKEVEKINSQVKFDIDTDKNVFVDGRCFYPPIGDEVEF